MIKNGVCIMDRRMTVPRFVIATDIENSVVVLNLNTKRYYILNSTAGEIWRAIAVGKSESEIVAFLFCEYDATREHITGSVARVFDTLENAKLIE
jgi:Coenzyme PQQ synthesis protein D (PqqD)